jgi:DNA-binding PadR family transcriptional regulator
MAVTYNLAGVSKLVNAALPGDVLDKFCAHCFPPTVQKFSAGTPRLWKIQLLLDYCKKYNLFQKLLEYLVKQSPAEYSRHKSLLTQPPDLAAANDSKRQVEVIFGVDFSQFSIELQLAATGALANCLDIPRDQISVLKVQPGTVILQVEMPASAAETLAQMYQAGAPDITDLGIIRLTLLEAVSAARRSGVIRKINGKAVKQTAQLFDPTPAVVETNDSPPNAPDQRGSNMVYTNPVRLRRIPGSGDETAETASGSAPKTPPLEPLDKRLERLLKEPRTIEATGIPESFLTSLALKILYFAGGMKGWQLAQAMRLNFSGVVEPILQNLRMHHLVQVTGGSNLNRASYQYAITDKGSGRARELLERNRYVGPCPVTLPQYIDAVKFHARNRPVIREADVYAVLNNLVLPQEIIDRIGPAVNSYRSMFLYGPPGNGKTSIGKAIGRGLLVGNIMIPYAIFESGQVITVFDRETHRPMVSEEAQLAESNGLDKRWVRCHAPVVITGGELTMQDLDLAWSDTNRYYEAPFQLKANGGMLLVDDFGRQQVGPKELLNRWIVPLEERLDFLTFHTGKKFAVPFETLLIFSTNLEPESLVDDAFLRRIRHKLGIDNPNEIRFHEIFTANCKQRGIRFNDQAFFHLLREYYYHAGRPMRACHPRDLLDQVADFANYRDEPAEMTIDLLDRAARSYFAELF